jgi:hypothetical protein
MRIGPRIRSLMSGSNVRKRRHSMDIPRIESGFDAWRRTAQHVEPKGARGYAAQAP